jgi:serine protease Do
MRRRTLLSAGLLGVGGLAGQAPARADVPAVIAAVRPSVLPIGRLDPLASPRFAFRGTAFVVGDGRYVVSNSHVVAADAPASDWVVQRTLPTGALEMRRLQLVQRDTDHDLVLMRVGGEPLPPLRLAPDDRLREGLDILFVGFPIAGVLGFQPVTHRGMVASLAPMSLPAPNAARLDERAITSLRRGIFDIAQLDATAYPGNSGGPVLDAATGEVVAVINMVLVRGGRESALTHPSGISYAIPARWVREMLAASGR